ncbi:MAG: hypothetical protein ACJA0N_001048 [Pseudohongiellaceae bacterium]|jgi:hypothetical protein
MGLGAEFLGMLKDTVRLTDSVERLNTANSKLRNKVDNIGDRVLKLETRLDTYVEIAGQQKIANK